jgi:hypothetical protein
MVAVSARLTEPAAAEREAIKPVHRREGKAQGRAEVGGGMTEVFDYSICEDDAR